MKPLVYNEAKGFFIGGGNMHFVQAKSILSSKNGINIYRGCTHGCIYCDSRSKCYGINHKFEDIAVKENAIELLEIELKKKRQKIMVSTGSMSDPYMQIEAKLKLTRKMLEVIEKTCHGVTLLTKSSLVLRDIDILKKINEKSKVVVSMTLTTANDDLCKLLEPNVSLTSERVKALKTLNEHHIETGVWLGPILPFINDHEENLMALLEACLEAKVKYILCFGIGLTLRDGNREYYYQKLDELFPGLKERYVKTYGNRYEVHSLNQQKLYPLFLNFCKKHNIMYDINEIFNYLGTYHSHEITLFNFLEE